MDKFKAIQEKISKLVDEDLKSMYAGTCTSSSQEQEPFTLDHMKRAVDMLRDMPPAPPDFIFNRHIGDDDAIQMDGTVIPFFKNGVVFVGKNVKSALEKEGIPVINFQRRNENDETTTIQSEEKSCSVPD